MKQGLLSCCCMNSEGISVPSRNGLKPCHVSTRMLWYSSGRIPVHSSQNVGKVFSPFLGSTEESFIVCSVECVHAHTLLAHLAASCIVVRDCSPSLPVLLPADEGDPPEEEQGKPGPTHIHKQRTVKQCLTNLHRPFIHSYSICQ